MEDSVSGKRGGKKWKRRKNTEKGEIETAEQRTPQMDAAIYIFCSPEIPY